jgi:hypothetical protein
LSSSSSAAAASRQQQKETNEGEEYPGCCGCCTKPGRARTSRSRAPDTTTSAPPCSRQKRSRACCAEPMTTHIARDRCPLHLSRNAQLSWVAGCGLCNARRAAGTRTCLLAASAEAVGECRILCPIGVQLSTRRWYMAVCALPCGTWLFAVWYMAVCALPYVVHGCLPCGTVDRKQNGYCY